jgi:hypothetical protein
MTHIELFAGVNPESATVFLSKVGIPQFEQYQHQDAERIEKELTRSTRNKKKHLAMNQMAVYQEPLRTVLKPLKKFA